MTISRAAITATGGYVPDKIVTNAEISAAVDTSDEWILARTGIRERRVLEPPAATSDMAVIAVQRLLEERGLSALEIDLIICATVSPDHVYPATANIIATKVGASNAWGYDIGAACAGFLFALWTGAKFVESGTHDKVIVVGADTMSRKTNPRDRETCILFGDGAGAVLLERDNRGYGLIDGIMKSNGSGQEFLYQKAGGSKYPSTEQNVKDGDHFVTQSGAVVFKHAVKGFTEVARQIMDRNGLGPGDLSFFIPHQANRRIIDSASSNLGLAPEQVLLNIDRYGNTTNASIPLCIWENADNFEPGQNIILASFGGGFSWGGIYLSWASDGARLEELSL
ncbi:ketoacyl-ACP synthase III [Halioglobus maricola]|uniref:Beta-ketoacyl-[acyl-carrier-protein] synthase III n=1 Tax=Halioglobus maricola TaxID=2601894 RepID=A0A5P9NPG0_9GAMM|nr:beta-ketoacyl-ACP synthase III [Halioglobus maricola]QFU77710.1 ketoacyl-ACP synthase III [Halioglobus maricola]